MRTTACVVALVLAALGLGAQGSGSAEAPVVDVGQIDVSSEAYSPVTLAPAGSVTVITADDIVKSGANNVAEALVTAPGAWVNSGGPGGSLATASIAGSTSNQVLVIVDGVRQNDARQGAPDLARIPAENIEKIEVLRSGASAVYGADAVGGVIVITTKKSGARRLSVRFENSAYPTAVPKNGATGLIDGQSLGLDAGSKLGLADLAFSAQAERASNAFLYNSSGSSYIRGNASFWSGAANLSVGIPVADGRLTLLAAGSYQDAGAPGSLSFSSPLAEQKNTNLSGSLGWSSDALAGGALVLDLQSHGGFSRLDYIDPSYPGLHDMTNGGIDLRATDLILPSIDLGFGASLLYEAANSPAFASNPSGQPNRFSLGGYFQPEFRLGDNFKIKPALRYDWNANYVAGLSAMLDAVWKANEALDLRLSGGRSYRAPTFNDLYYSDPYYHGNPNLKPETSWSTEMGFDLHQKDFSLSANAQVRYVTDLIITTPDYSTMDNLNTALIPNATVEASYKIGPATVKVNYEFLYPLDLSAGQTISDNVVLTNYSRHKAGGSVDLLFGPVGAGIIANYWSERVSSGSTLNGALIVNLNASYKVSKNLRINVAAENLLDTTYQVNYDYPMPGLTVKAGVKIDLF